MNAAKNMYTKVSTREQAAIMLRSWLEAVGILVLDTIVRDYDFAIVTSEGSFLFIRVVQGNMSAPADAITVRAEELRCSRLSETHLKDTRSPQEIAFAAFHTITQKAGFGSPLPLDRGQEPDRKFNFEDDGWLVPFRHTEFRRAPNPPEAKYKQYQMIMERQAYLFYVTNTELCERNSHSLEDLQSMAYFALTSFCAHHERPEGKNHENEKILTKYLKQRFAELRKRWMSEAKRRTPESGFVAIWSGDTALVEYDGAHPDVGRYGEMETYLAEQNDESDDILDRVEHNEISMDEVAFEELSNDDAMALRTDADDLDRETRVKDALTAALAAMPHSEMIEKLLHVSYSQEFDRETQRMAEKTLNSHCRKCRLCSNGSEVNEELSGVDARSA